MINIVNILDESTRLCPDKTALRYKGRSFTYFEMKERVDRLASVLVDKGVKKQQNVAIISPNSGACIEILFACARLDAVCEQYNVRLSGLTLAQLLERSNASVVFLPREMHKGLIGYLDIVSRPLTFIFLNCVEGGVEKCESEYEKLIAGAHPLSIAPLSKASDAAVLFYTSGTTGIPRGVLLSHQVLLARLKIDVPAMEFVHDDVFLCVLPLFHVTCVTCFAVFAVGGEVVIADSRRAENIADLLIKHSVTCTSFVPFFLRGLAAYIEGEGIEVKTLRLIVYGGESIDLGLLTRCQKIFKCGFLQGYGMTETSSAITMLLPKQHEVPQYLLTVGKAARGIELKVVDECGHDCLLGTRGEIAVRADSLMLGYYQDPKYTASVIRDGWYFTGDIGFLDEEGFLSLVDRKNNLVITGGENVYPLEVSRCIKSMGEDVVDAAVVGIPDEYWGESLVAFVVLRQEATIAAEEIIAYCVHHLGGYKKPQKVCFVEGLVRNSSGKIAKDQLKKLRDLFIGEDI